MHIKTHIFVVILPQYFAVAYNLKQRDVNADIYSFQTVFIPDQLPDLHNI